LTAAETGMNGVVPSCGHVLLEVIPRVHQIDPPSYMVKQLLQRTAFRLIPCLGGCGLKNPCKGIRRPVQRGRALLLQPVQRLQLKADLPIKFRPCRSSPAVTPPEEQREYPGTQ